MLIIQRRVIFFKQCRKFLKHVQEGGKILCNLEILMTMILDWKLLEKIMIVVLFFI